MLAAQVAPSHAQIPVAGDGGRSWQVALWMKGGYQAPSGKFAQTRASDIPELENFTAQFRVDASPLVGAAVELRFPAHGMSTRLEWERSGVADAVGRLGLCNVLEGPICDPELAPTQFQALLLDFRYLMRRREDAIRPFFMAGGGLREMAIAAPACDRSGEAQRICQTVVALYQDPSPHSYWRLGLGLQAMPGPLIVDVAGSVGTGLYSGGTARTEGTWYDEFRLEVSAGFVVY